MPRTRPGRATKLTPALQQAIVNAVAAGVSLSTAAELAGLHPTCVKGWYQRGMGEHPTRAQTPLYHAFSLAVIKARAQDETRRVARLEQAGRGGAVVYRETVTQRDGSVMVRERFEPPNIAADMFHLERKYHEQWGRKDRIDLRATIQQTAQTVADELGIPVEDLLAKAQARLAQIGPANKVA